MADTALSGSDAAPLGDEWMRAFAVEDLPVDSVRDFRLRNRLIAVYHIGDKFYATDGVCTHAFARMAEGYLDEEIIECPLHQAEFHVPTGKVLSGPAVDPLRCFEVCVKDGAIYVKVGQD